MCRLQGLRSITGARSSTGTAGKAGREMKKSLVGLAIVLSTLWVVSFTQAQPPVTSPLTNTTGASVSVAGSPDPEPLSRIVPRATRRAAQLSSVRSSSPAIAWCTYRSESHSANTTATASSVGYTGSSTATSHNQFADGHWRDVWQYIALLWWRPITLAPFGC